MLMRLIASSLPIRTLIVHSPAKINVFLNVLGKRPDGYHELDTIMVAVNLYDTLCFREALQPGKISLRSRWLIDVPSAQMSAIPEDDRNLVVKAAFLLKEYTQKADLGVSIALDKRIPVEAGLGGGSSDAAATLVGLNHFWQLGLTGEELHLLASKLGSDVNFFLTPTPVARCLGRGEQIKPIPDLSPLYAVVIKPESGLSTKAVFDAYHTHVSSTTVSAEDVLDSWQTTGSPPAAMMFNALQAGACQVNADVEKILKHLSHLPGATGIMTGSGTACVAIVKSPRHATQLARHLHEKPLLARDLPEKNLAVQQLTEQRRDVCELIDHLHGFVVSVRSSL